MNPEDVPPDVIMIPSNRKFGGWSLKVYWWEEQTYPQFKEFRVEKSRATFYLKKFSRHFKVYCPRLSSIQKRGGGHYRPNAYGNALIALPKHPSLGLICHEFAHHLDAIRHPDTAQWHGKSFKRELKKVYTFAKRYLPETQKTPPPEEVS